jgi:hypothetical protein
MCCICTAYRLARQTSDFTTGTALLGTCYRPGWCRAVLTCTVMFVVFEGLVKASSCTAAASATTMCAAWLTVDRSVFENNINIEYVYMLVYTTSSAFD